MKNIIINMANTIRIGNSGTPTLGIRVTYSKDKVTINRAYSVDFLIRQTELEL